MRTAFMRQTQIMPHERAFYAPETILRGPLYYVGATTATFEGNPIKELVHDEAILSTPCEPATAEDADLAQDLIDTLASIDDAVCLAANQIGVTKAVVVYQDDNGQPHVMYNPKVLAGFAAAKVEESCLTHEEPVRVTRFAKIKVSFDELVDGELRPRRRDYTGWTAQMIQHMADHCKGKLV